MDYLKMIPLAMFALFRGFIWLSLRLALLALFGILAFFLHVIPVLAFGWSMEVSMGACFVLILLIYIGYKINKNQ